jgi:peptidoglycan/LPS O-acetylase OafA/YrhL
MKDMSVAEKPKPQIPVLTSLRFFAAAAIVCFHGLGFLIANPNSSLALGVSFFFVLSGFILTYANDNAGRAVGRFYLGRVARIWPIHVVTLLASVPILQINQVDPAMFMANLLLVHAWYPSGASVFSFNGVAWSLSIEAVFYLMFPLLVRIKRIELVFVGSLALALLGIAFVSQYPLVMPAANPYAPNWLNFVLQNPITRLPEFLIGMIAARRFAQRPMMLSTGAATCVEVASLAFLAIFIMSSPLNFNWYPARTPQALSQWIQQCGGLFNFALLIFVLASSSGYVSRLLSWKPLVLLGEISFCTYMVHLLILRFAARQYTMSAFSVTAAVIVIYLSSYILWRFVERPCRKAIVSIRQNKCQSAFNFDPRSASNFDPLEPPVRAVALAPSELAGVAGAMQEFR